MTKGEQKVKAAAVGTSQDEQVAEARGEKAASSHNRRDMMLQSEEDRPVAVGDGEMELFVQAASPLKLARWTGVHYSSRLTQV